MIELKFRIVVQGGVKLRHAAALTCLEPAEGAGQLVPLRGQTISVGRVHCDVVVNDPTVSARHAIFCQSEAVWSIEDAGSTNGTWVNGKMVKGRTALADGDHLAFGSARFFFHDGSAALAAATGRGPASSKDRRLPDRIFSLPPYDFEKLTRDLFAKLGFESIVTKQSGDGGVDVVAVNNGVIFRGKYLVQCKRYRTSNKVSRPEVTAFFGRVASEPGAKGIFVTSSSFTRGAKEFAQSNGINLIDGEELERLVLRHGLM